MNLGGKREDLGNGAKNGGFGPSGNGAVLSIEGGGKMGPKKGENGKWGKNGQNWGRNGENGGNWVKNWGNWAKYGRNWGEK